MTSFGHAVARPSAGGRDARVRPRPAPQVRVNSLGSIDVPFIVLVRVLLEEDEVEEAFSAAQIKKAVAMAKKSGGQMTPVSKKIEKIKKGLSDHEEVKAALKAANEAHEVQEAHEEALKMHAKITEAVDKKAAYKKVFDAALKKFGVKSPAELKGDKKKEFFDYVDMNYDAGEYETD